MALLVQVIAYFFFFSSKNHEKENVPKIKGQIIYTDALKAEVEFGKLVEEM